MAHQQVWAALEVALRVPCLYIIDAIFNSYYDSSQSRLCIVLQIFLRLLGKETGSLRAAGRTRLCPGTGAIPRRSVCEGRRRAGTVRLAAELTAERSSPLLREAPESRVGAFLCEEATRLLCLLRNECWLTASYATALEKPQLCSSR